MAEKSNCPVQNRVIAFNLTFPYDEDPPTGFFQKTLISPISTDIASKFLSPEFIARLGDISLLATMPVPEASMDKNHDVPFRKDQIGTPGKLPDVRTKAIAHCVKRTTDKHLRFRVNTTNATHESATLIEGQDVRHPKSPMVFMNFIAFPNARHYDHLLNIANATAQFVLDGSSCGHQFSPSWFSYAVSIHCLSKSHGFLNDGRGRAGTIPSRLALYKVRKETDVGITRCPNNQTSIQKAVSRFTGRFR